MTNQSKLLSVAFVCLFGIAGTAASLLWRHAPPPLVLSTGTWLNPSRKIDDFSLIDQQGRTYSAANLRGHWSLLFFGYTHCPGFCPATLTTLASMQKQLRAAKAPALAQVIFVSVDARRDTPEQLAKYVPYFDPEFIGLTAPDQPAIEAFARKLGVLVTIPPAADGNYAVDHTGAIFVVDPDAQIAAILTGPFTAEALRGDYQRIVATRP